MDSRQAALGDLQKWNAAAMRLRRDGNHLRSPAKIRLARRTGWLGPAIITHGACKATNTVASLT